ncbi:MAG TPA: hypothetical protein VFO82_00710 [Steroidobacteraceae bacterium]|nr:hypothetical protein [Steroidobacteraceae bacterium]
MVIKGIRTAMAFCVVASIAAIGPLANAEPSNKWRIIFDHSTDAAGEVVFRITPLNGTPIDVTTQIPKGTGENQAAQLVKKSLKESLGKGYKVEVDDFETVLIKKASKTPVFDVTLASSTISGLSINLKRE